MTDERSEGGGSSLYAWYSLGVLMLVYMMNFIDRQILSILAEDVKAHFQVTDAQLGFLYGTAFAIFYSIFGIPLGRLADSWTRPRLIGLGLLAWSMMTTLSGLAASFVQLAAARVGVAVGEAAASPAAYSILSDLFSRQRRARALAIYTAGGYVGMGLSLPIGGWVVTRWNALVAEGRAPLPIAGWQAAFLTVGVPGILLALVAMSLREPGRSEDQVDGGGSQQGPAVAPLRVLLAEIGSILPPFTLWSASRYPGGLRWNVTALGAICLAASALIWATGDFAQWIAIALGAYATLSWSQSLRRTDPEAYAATLGNRTLMLALAGSGLIAFFTYGFGFWATPYALRTFHVSKAVAGVEIGLPAAVVSVAGLVGGAWISDHFSQRTPRARFYLCMACALLPLPFAATMFVVASFQTYALLSLCVYLSFSGYVGSAIAGCHELVPPRMRATVGASFLLSSTLLGLALGPYCAGKVATVSGSLQLGMFTLLPVLPVSAFVLWLATRRIGSR